MAGRLNQPGVNVYQILEDRKPTAYRPVMVPTIIGEHYNIQRHLPLVYHYANSTNSDVAIPTGATAVVQQKFEATSDIDVFVNSDRGLIKLTETTDYTVSLDAISGVDNLITVDAALSKSKELVAGSTATSITNQSFGGTNYLVIQDSSVDFSESGVSPGDIVTIDFTSSVNNLAATFVNDLSQALILRVSSVESSGTLKATWEDNNALWTDELSVGYSIDTPEITGTIDTTDMYGSDQTLTMSYNALVGATHTMNLEGPSSQFDNTNLVVGSTDADWVGVQIKVTLATVDTGANVGAFDDADHQYLTIYSKVDDENVLCTYDNVNDGAAFVTESIDATLNQFVPRGISGQVYVSYDNAIVVNDANTLIEISGITDIRDNFGTLEPENPLGFHCQAGALATDRIFYAVRTAGTSSDDYEIALDYLKTVEDAYYIIPTTNSATVHSLCQTHVNYMSEPTQKGERVTIINKDVPEYDTVSTGMGGTTFFTYQVHATTSATTTIKLGGAVGTATFDDVKPGHILRPIPGAAVKLADGSYVDSEKINLVVLEYTPGPELIKVAGQITAAHQYDAASPYVGTFVDPITLSSTVLAGAITSVTYKGGEKARIVAAMGEGINSKRTVNVFPDVVQIPVTRATQTAPNYNVVTASSTEAHSGTVAAALIGCHSSALTPSQPQSNIAVPGLVSVVGSNDELNSDNLDVIAGGGNWILINSKGSNLVTTRHQLTTAVSDINTREFSVVKSVDYAAKVFRTYLRPLVGSSVITDSFVKKVVRPVASSALHALVDGGLISANSKILRIYQSEINPTSIVVEVSIDPLYPANTFDVKLYI